MKKKIAITIFSILIIVSILLLINIARNYLILQNIYKTNEKESNFKNYYFENITEYAHELATIKSIIYLYNGVYNVKTFRDDKLVSINWYDSNTNESININENGENTIENTDWIENSYKEILLNETKISDILCQNFFRPFVIEDNKYKIKYSDTTIYINKKTGLVEKVMAGDTIQTYKLQKDIVTKSDVEKVNSL